MKIKSDQARFVFKVAAVLLACGLVRLLEITFLDEAVAILVPGMLFLASLYFIFLEPTAFRRGRSAVIKGATAAALLLIAWWLALPPRPEAMMPWRMYSDQALAAARSAHKPVMIDFYADWCPGCRVLDEWTFSRRNVVEAMRDFVVLRADLTDRAAPESIRIALKFGVEGFPTVIFFGSDGVERVDQRLLGSESPAVFLRRIRSLR